MQTCGMKLILLIKKQKVKKQEFDSRNLKNYHVNLKRKIKETIERINKTKTEFLKTLITTNLCYSAIKRRMKSCHLQQHGWDLESIC